MSTGWEHDTGLNSLYSLMKARVIEEQLIEGGHGQYQANEQFGKPSLFEGEGMFTTSFLSQTIAHQDIRYSVLPAMSLDGILGVDIVEGSFDTVRFARFIDGLLDQMSPYPGPNSVIVMDNCSIHKHPLIVEMIEERYVAKASSTMTAVDNNFRGMRCEFLPPYSPDYNPIELAFSAIKSHIKRNGEVIRIASDNIDNLDVFLLLHEAVWSVTPLDAKGWFYYCGYM